MLPAAHFTALNVKRYVSDGVEFFPSEVPLTNSSTVSPFEATLMSLVVLAG
jgi:hypothetical protein